MADARRPSGPADVEIADEGGADANLDPADQDKEREDFVDNRHAEGLSEEEQREEGGEQFGTFAEGNVSMGRSEDAHILNSAVSPSGTLSLNSTQASEARVKPNTSGFSKSPSKPAKSTSGRSPMATPRTRGISPSNSMSQRSVNEASRATSKFPKSWSPGWYEVCARMGVLPEDLLERPASYFWTVGANAKTLSMRHAHYEQRRKERLEMVSASFLKVESEGNEGESVIRSTSPSPENKRKEAMLRRVRDMKVILD